MAKCRVRKEEARDIAKEIITRIKSKRDLMRAELKEEIMNKWYNKLLDRLRIRKNSAVNAERDMYRDDFQVLRISMYGWREEDAAIDILKACEITSDEYVTLNGEELHIYATWKETIARNST
jgi:hypothetical protein